VRSTAIHTATQPQLHTLLKAMDLQAKLISRVRTIYLLSWEKTGQTKKELSAFWKKDRKNCKAGMCCSLFEKNTLSNNLPVRKLASIHWNAWEDNPKWNKMLMELLTCEKIIASTLSPKERNCFRSFAPLWIWLKMKTFCFLWT